MMVVDTCRTGLFPERSEFFTARDAKIDTYFPHLEVPSEIGSRDSPQRITNKHQKMTALQAIMLGASISNHPAKVNDVQLRCCTSPIIRRQVIELETMEQKSVASAKSAFSVENALIIIQLTKPTFLNYER
jgi:hypothetical protein